MSACLIITQNDKIYIGADSACTTIINNEYYRLHNNLEKIVNINNYIIFFSGSNISIEYAKKWIKTNFINDENLSDLSLFLKNNIKNTEKDIYDIEIIIVNYYNKQIYQLSQYNNFEIITYYPSKDIQLIACGYNTKKCFNLAKKYILQNIDIYDIYKQVFNELSDECVGGNLTIYINQNYFNTFIINENPKIKYIQYYKDTFSINADFVVSGFIQGTTIVGGQLYSPIRQDGTHMTHIDLENGNINIGNGSFIYNNSTNSLTLKNGRFESATIVGGSFETSSGGFIVNNDGTFNIGNGSIRYNGSKLIFGSGVTLTWNQIDNAPDLSNVVTSDTVTTITQNAISTATISANQINGGTIKGVEIGIGNYYNWGSSGNSIPYFYVDSSGNAIIKQPVANRLILSDLGSNYIGIQLYYIPFKTENFIDDSGYVSRSSVTIGILEGQRVYNIESSSIPCIIGFNELYMKEGYIDSYWSSGISNICNIRDVKEAISMYSDLRIKNNVDTIKDIYDNYMLLEPVSFSFINNTTIEKDWNKEYGLIAQDVEKVFPDLVGKTKPLTDKQEELCGDEIYTLNYNGLHALHIKMIQKQQKEIDELKGEIERIKQLL